MSAENFAAIVFFSSVLAGIALFGTYLMLNRKICHKYLSNDDLWFEAQPKPIVYIASAGVGLSPYLPLNIEGHKAEIPLDCDFLKKNNIVPKNVHLEGYQLNIPIKVCVVGKDIIGIKYGDLPKVLDTAPELSVELTSIDKQLKTRMRLNNILLILAFIACIPGAWVVLNMIAALLR